MLEQASAPVLDEIVRQAELRLQAQFAAATAADARAGVLASFNAAGAFALLIASKADSTLKPERSAFIVEAFFLLVACALAAAAARPSNWGFAGFRPGFFNQDIAQSRTLHTVKAEYASHLDGHLIANEQRLSSSAWLVRSSLFMVVCTGALAILTALAA